MIQLIVAEQMINAKVNEVRPQLPADATTEVERMNATVFPVLGLTLKSKTLTPTELWNLATYNLKPRLTRVPGVSRLIVQGGRPPEIAVELKVGAMAELGLAPTDVVNALASGNVIRSIGVVDRQYQRFRVSVDGEAHSVDDVRVIVVGLVNGATPAAVAIKDGKVMLSKVMYCSHSIQLMKYFLVIWMNLIKNMHIA